MLSKEQIDKLGEEGFLTKVGISIEESHEKTMRNHKEIMQLIEDAKSPRGLTKGVNRLTIISNITFYKAIVLKIDILESSIIDEQHFQTLQEAESFASGCPSDVICVIIQM